MEILGHLGYGFGIALQPINLLYAFIGCLVGTLIGVLPGIGPAGGMALLIPLTYGKEPASAIIRTDCSRLAGSTSCSRNTLMP